ncbi:reverse transcriptase domain containing protein [Babesia caballi]|uniref:Reverse transcriptase domain containing protein n=1 Tax=Babesia caballi TaxID=5871 RepID=A0AAV4LRX5_BABCB|nr:reverse transcriptase domain containing protein [Babesia caballi]
MVTWRSSLEGEQGHVLENLRGNQETGKHAIGHRPIGQESLPSRQPVRIDSTQLLHRSSTTGTLPICQARQDGAHTAIREGGSQALRQHKPPLPSTQRAGRRYPHASLIATYLHDKYGLTIRDNEAIPKTIQHLRKLQNRSLYNVISTTKLHKLLFSRRELDSVDLEESTLWLRKSMLTPQEEAKLINLQDRNLQWMSSKKNHKKCGKYLDVEHLASKCDRLLHTDYVRRHNEVARRIHRTLAKELGVKNIKKVERYKIDDRKFTKNGWISYDMSIHTEKKVQFNRPDIIVADKRKNRITIVEIGITSQHSMTSTSR